MDESEFALHARNWTVLAQRSPFWAVLSQPGAEQAEFDADVFFKDGADFLLWLRDYVQQLGVELQAGRVLDFGCGLGRLTQGLAAHCSEVHGVDIALPMIEGARRYNRHGDRCTYHHNQSLDLALFEDASFDAVMTVLVLQHMRPEFMKVYLREFMRILRPGGIAFFQVPICPIIPVADSTEPRVDVPAHAAARAYDVRLQVRPQGLGTSIGVIRDVQVVVHNDSDAPLAPLEIHGRIVELESRREAPGTRTSVVTGSGIAARGSRVAVLPVQSPGAEGQFELEVTAVHPDPFVDLRVAAPPARTQVSQFKAADSDADPRTQWRAHAVGEKVTKIGTMDVYYLPLEEVVATVEAGGGEIVRIDEDDWSGPHHVSCHVTVRRR